MPNVIVEFLNRFRSSSPRSSANMPPGATVPLPICVLCEDRVATLKIRLGPGTRSPNDLCLLRRVRRLPGSGARTENPRQVQRYPPRDGRRRGWDRRGSSSRNACAFGSGGDHGAYRPATKSGGAWAPGQLGRRRRLATGCGRRSRQRPDRIAAIARNRNALTVALKRVRRLAVGPTKGRCDSRPHSASAHAAQARADGPAPDKTP